MLSNDDRPPALYRAIRRLRVCLTAYIIVVSVASPCRAQETNVSRYQELALRCFASLPDTLRGFVLDGAPGMAYLRPALVDRWQRDGRTIYVADTVTAALPPPLPVLRYRVEEATVEYERQGRRRLQRTVRLSMHLSALSPEGRLLDERRCSESLTDTIPRSAVAVVESGAFPETRAPIPEASWIRRYVEPVVVTAATVIGVYLFFSLRSRQGEEAP